MDLNNSAMFRINFYKRLAGGFWQEAVPISITILAYGAACAYKSKVVTLILSRCMPVSNHSKRDTLVFGVDKPPSKLGPVWLIEVGMRHDLHMDHVPVVKQTLDASDSVCPPISTLDVERQPEATL